MTGIEPGTVTKVCRSEPLSETVVTAVAEAKDVDPLDLEPLYTVVDPDALDSIFRPIVGRPPTSVEVRFSMADCQVEIHGDGEVVVTPPETRNEHPATVTQSKE